MKLATESDSKLECIIDAKLVETVQKMKENMQKIEVSISGHKYLLTPLQITHQASPGIRQRRLAVVIQKGHDNN